MKNQNWKVSLMRQTYSLKRSWSLSDSVTDKKHYRDETSTKFVWKTLSFQVKYGVTTKKTHMMSNSQAAKLVRGFCRWCVTGWNVVSNTIVRSFRCERRLKQEDIISNCLINRNNNGIASLTETKALLLSRVPERWNQGSFPSRIV